MGNGFDRLMNVVQVFNISSTQPTFACVLWKFNHLVLLIMSFNDVIDENLVFHRIEEHTSTPLFPEGDNNLIKPLDLIQSKIKHKRADKSLCEKYLHANYSVI